MARPRSVLTPGISHKQKQIPVHKPKTRQTTEDNLKGNVPSKLRGRAPAHEPQFLSLLGSL